MMIEIKIAPYESASAGERSLGKSQENPAAKRVVMLRSVSAKTCCRRHHVNKNW